MVITKEVGVKRNSILFKGIIGSVFVLLITLLTSSVVFSAEDKSGLVPMDLDGTEWEVEMVTVLGKGKKDTSSDTFIFKDKKFVSKNFEKRKYEPTNYSLVLEEDGSTKFGTMQIKGKETSFWKGNIKGDTIDGSVHTQLSGGTSKTTYFKGKLTSGALVPKVKIKPKFPKPAPIAIPKPVEPVAEQVQPVVDDIKQEPVSEVVPPQVEVPSAQSDEASTDSQ